jgi:hypothetical protein
LKRGIGDIDSHVVARARRRFAAQIQLAVSERRVEGAIEVYQQTLGLPQTATEAMLDAEGYKINGNLHAGNEDLVICYKGVVPCPI